MNDHATENFKDNLGIGDVSKICQIPVHTVRYWECEFDGFLRPTRTMGRQRRYGDQDIEKVLHIKDLLWTRRFSIKAAKRILNAGTDNKIKSFNTRPNNMPNNFLIMRMAQFAGEIPSAFESAAA
jgi:DNA-binding transcriptional MerR regulator